MPTYTYQCRACQAVTELSHGMRETPRPACPVCGGLTQRIVPSAPAVLKQGAPPASEGEPVPDAHDCGSGCVLHRKPKAPTPKADSNERIN